MTDLRAMRIVALANRRPPRTRSSAGALLRELGDAPGTVGEMPVGPPADLPPPPPLPDQDALRLVNAQKWSWPTSWVIVTRPFAMSYAKVPVPALDTHWMSATCHPAGGSAWKV